MTPLVSKAILIDDSDIDLFIQRRFLEVNNFSGQLLVYQTAAEALQWLQGVDKETAPDVIFLDLNMPDIDGFSFLESFRTLPGEIRKKTKIVVLTSSNNAKDRQRAFSSENVVEFITKPMKKTDIEILKKLVAR